MSEAPIGEPKQRDLRKDKEFVFVSVSLRRRLEKYYDIMTIVGNGSGDRREAEKWKQIERGSPPLPPATS